VEGIGRLEHWMDDFAHVQTEMQASIDSQTSMMQTSWVTLGSSLMLKSFKDLSLGEVLGAQVCACLVSLPAFPVISSLVLLIGRITTVVMTANKYCFP
jgi:hypothetical protein